MPEFLQAFFMSLKTYMTGLLFQKVLDDFGAKPLGTHFTHGTTHIGFRLAHQAIMAFFRISQEI